MTRVAVIGAGIAGASVSRALIAAGIDTVVVEAERPGAGASGFPTALVTPRLDAGDVVIAGLYAQALRRAGDLYESIPDAVVARGVLQLEQVERDALRFARIAAQPVWGEGEMTVFDADAASARLDEPVSIGGLHMRSALTVRPAAILKAWLTGTEIVTGAVAAVQADGDGWRFLDAEEGVLVRADAVIIAAGWGSAALLPQLGLKPARGQADWVEGPTPPAVAWGGYVAPTGEGFLFGATHDRDDESTDIRATDSARNRRQIEDRLPRLAQAAVVRGHARAAIRATTRDRLPVCGALSDMPGVFVLGGLGSRGFCVAPLLGDHLAAILSGTPSPLPADMAHRLRPDRLHAGA